MKKEITVPVTQEQANLLQRYGMEMECRYDIIARIIENHKGDPNDEVLSSAAFESYHRKAAESKLAYETAKGEFANSYLAPIVEKQFGENVDFDWSIDDFSILQAKVTVNAA